LIPVAHNGLLSVDSKVLVYYIWQFHGDVGKHPVVSLPGFFGGVNVKTGSGAKVPSVLLSGNVAAT
jgi:hypothetical protein